MNRSLARSVVLMLLIIAALPASVTARSVGDWDYVYYANIRPTGLLPADLWTFQRDPEQGKGSVKTEIVNGQLHVTTAAKFEYRRTNAEDPILDSDALTLEIRSYVAASPACLDGPCFGHTFGNVYSLPGGGTRSSIALHIWQTTLIIEDPNSNPDPRFTITPGYHTLRIAQTISGGSIRVFVDGIPMWSGLPGGGSATVASPRVALHFERDTESYVDYIAYTQGNFAPSELASPPLPFRLPFTDTYPISEGPRCGDHTTAVQAEAIDFKLPLNTPVYAADDGTVNVAGKGTGKLANFGIYVRIDHPDGSRSYYAHLSATTVAPGDAVLRGERIGSSGNTGKSTGPHLHFQVLDSEATAVPIRTIEGITWINPDDPCQEDAEGNNGYATGSPVP